MDFKEEAYDGICRVIGEIVLRLERQGRQISKEAIADELRRMPGDDLGVMFALELLRA